MSRGPVLGGAPWARAKKAVRYESGRCVSKLWSDKVINAREECAVQPREGFQGGEQTEQEERQDKLGFGLWWTA
jgi:hypothetical protein